MCGYARRACAYVGFMFSALTRAPLCSGREMHRLVLKISRHGGCAGTTVASGSPRRAPASRYTSGPPGVRLTFAPGAVVSSSIAASRISHRAEGTAHGSRGSHGDPEGFVRSRCCVATETTPVAHVAWRPALVARRARRLLVRRAHPCRATTIVPENPLRCGESRMNCTHRPNLPVNLTRGCCEARRASRPPLAARRRASRCGARVNPAQVTGNSVRQTERQRA